MPAGSSTDKKQVWLVTDSLPLAGDCDQTLPMHMHDGEIPAQVGVLLEREECHMETGGSKDLPPHEHETGDGQAGPHVTYLSCANICVFCKCMCVCVRVCVCVKCAFKSLWQSSTFFQKSSTHACMLYVIWKNAMVSTTQS